MADDAQQRPGFARIATPRTVAAMWVVTAGFAALFLALGWSTLQLGLALVPLVVVTIAMTVSSIRRRRAAAS